MSRYESGSSGGGGGVGFSSLLAIVFIALKLTGHIDWPWLWVLSPLWIGLAIVAVVFLGILLVAGISTMLAVVLGERR